MAQLWLHRVELNLVARGMSLSASSSSAVEKGHNEEVDQPSYTTSSLDGLSSTPSARQEEDVGGKDFSCQAGVDVATPSTAAASGTAVGAFFPPPETSRGLAVRNEGSGTSVSEASGSGLTSSNNYEKNIRQANLTFISSTGWLQSHEAISRISHVVNEAVETVIGPIAPQARLTFEQVVDLLRRTCEVIEEELINNGRAVNVMLPENLIFTFQLTPSSMKPRARASAPSSSSSSSKRTTVATGASEDTHRRDNESAEAQCLDRETFGTPCESVGRENDIHGSTVAQRLSVTQSLPELLIGEAKDRRSTDDAGRCASFERTLSGASEFNDIVSNKIRLARRRNRTQHRRESERKKEAWRHVKSEVVGYSCRGEESEMLETDDSSSESVKRRQEHSYSPSAKRNKSRNNRHNSEDEKICEQIQASPYALNCTHLTQAATHRVQTLLEETREILATQNFEQGFAAIRAACLDTLCQPLTERLSEADGKTGNQVPDAQTRGASLPSFAFSSTPTAPQLRINATQFRSSPLMDGMSQPSVDESPTSATPFACCFGKLCTIVESMFTANAHEPAVHPVLGGMPTLGAGNRILEIFKYHEATLSLTRAIYFKDNSGRVGNEAVDCQGRRVDGLYNKSRLHARHIVEVMHSYKLGDELQKPYEAQGHDQGRRGSNTRRPAEARRAINPPSMEQKGREKIGNFFNAVLEAVNLS